MGCAWSPTTSTSSRRARTWRSRASVLSLRARVDEFRKPHLPVDIFLRALAAARGSHAIGVILSGTASDGTDGLRAIKEESGITLRAGAAVGEVRRDASERRRGRRRGLLPAAAAARPGARAAEPSLLYHYRPGGAAPARPGWRDARAALLPGAPRRRDRLQRIQVGHLRAAARPPDGAAPHGEPAGLREARSRRPPTRLGPSTRTSSSTSPLSSGIRRPSRR